MSQLLCKLDDVFVGYGGAGVVKVPEEHANDPEWLRSHCWVCRRSAAEVEADPHGRRQPEPAARVTVTVRDELGDSKTLGEWVTAESGEHTPIDRHLSENPGEDRPSKEVTRYVDQAMFDAEDFDREAQQRPRVFLLSATPDPLGAVAAFSMMYEGRVVRDLAEISDDERRHYFDECFKTALKTPLEAIDFHFMVEGMTRATFDQMRTQRTATFAGESLRFAVKDDLRESVRPGPLVKADEDRLDVWDRAIKSIEEAYHVLIGSGVPAEDARGLLPMNVLTRAHWKSNLRNLESEIGKRLCTQAQFEWRQLHADLRRAVRECDKYWYKASNPQDGVTYYGGPAKWQFEYIANSPMFVPICFQKGACMFKASMDRGCTIRERVDRGALNEIRPEEWLADPKAAWVK